jgi:hypothetical protein
MISHGFFERYAAASPTEALADQGDSMDNLQLKQIPITKTGMLIRKPVADCDRVAGI